MKLNELKIESHLRRDIHSVIGENSLISSYYVGRGHFPFPIEKFDKEDLDVGYDINLIFTL